MNKLSFGISNLIPIVSCVLLSYSSISFAQSNVQASCKTGTSHLTATFMTQRLDTDVACAEQYRRHLSRLDSVSCTTDSCMNVSYTVHQKFPRYIDYSSLYPDITPPNFTLQYLCCAAS